MIPQYDRPSCPKVRSPSHSPKVIFHDLIKIVKPFSMAWLGTFDKAGEIR